MRRLAAWVLLFLQPALAAGATVLVLYPEAPPPYRQAFAQMVAGIERSAGHPVRALALPEDGSAAPVRRWIDTYRDDGATLVLLGQRTVAVGEALATGLRVLVGGINRLPGQVKAPGISLIIDPALVLDTVRDLLPSTKSVVVVYNAQHQGLIPLVEKAAAERGLTIWPLAVPDAASAIEKLSRIIGEINPHTTALWFTQDTISLNTELIFPFVVEETWKRRIPAFSETVSHTRRGFLFSLYPDFEGIGVELGERIRNVTGSSQGFTFTRAARLAVNTRTARHLGLSLRTKAIEKADALFPEP